MTALSRRSLLAGAAALTVAGSVNAPARAAAPMAGKQGPSFYRYKIGEFEVTTLNEGVVRNATPANMAVNKTLPDIQKALGDAFLPTDHVINQFNVVIVNTGRNLVLIDTGFGDNGAPTTGNLLSNMTAAGIDPKNVDTILISHFHSDHINGIRAKAGSLNFPNAEIMVPATDLKFFLDAGEESKAPQPFKSFFAGQQARVRADRQGRQAVRVRQGTGARHRDCGRTRPQPGPHGVSRHVGQWQAAGELRYGQSPDPGPQSGLGTVGGHGSGDGGGFAQAPARYGGSRQDPDRRLPPAVPVDRLHLQAR